MSKQTEYSIIGTRQNGEVLYYVSDATQGTRFVPNAYSLAYVWRKHDVAMREVENMARQYRGLVVSLEPRQ